MGRVLVVILKPPRKLLGLIGTNAILTFGDNQIVFVAHDGYAANGQVNQQLWISDGTAQNTVPLTNFSAPYQPRGPVVNGNKIFFVGGNATTGLELWVSDGTVAGTKMTRDVCLGTCDGAFLGSEIGTNVPITPLANGLVILRGQSSTSGQEYVVSNGQASGTYVVDAVAGSVGSRPLWFSQLANGSIVFNAVDAVLGYEPWVVAP